MSQDIVPLLQRAKVPTPVLLEKKRHRFPTMPLKQQVLPKYIFNLQSNPPR